MNIDQYPVTTPFGQVPGYPLNGGFHQGIDYGLPMGTPVIVNGVQIGLSNNTGASTGPHLHVGKFVGGHVEDPGVGNGFTFDSAVVYDTGSDATNGNFVRVSGDGALWNYLHLQEVNVTARQELKGEDMSDIADFNFVNDAALGTQGHEINGDQNLLNNEGRPMPDVLREFVNYPESVEFRRRASAYDGLVSHIAELEAQVSALGATPPPSPAPSPSPTPPSVDTPSGPAGQGTSLWDVIKKFLSSFKKG